MRGRSDCVRVMVLPVDLSVRGADVERNAGGQSGDSGCMVKVADGPGELKDQRVVREDHLPPA